MIIGRGTRCCGSMPRCRTCPVRLAADIRAVLPEQPAGAEHLAGIPPCLHKYEPLFRRAETPARQQRI